MVVGVVVGGRTLKFHPCFHLECFRREGETKLPESNHGVCTTSNVYLFTFTRSVLQTPEDRHSEPFESFINKTTNSLLRLTISVLKS